jgi:hypothetical protein
MKEKEYTGRKLTEDEFLAKGKLLAETDLLKNLKEKWGEFWFESALPGYLVLAYSRAIEEGREPTEEDVLKEHYKNMKGVREEFEQFFQEGEQPEVGFNIAVYRFTKKPRILLFITNKRILCLNMKLSHFPDSAIELEYQESVVRYVGGKLDTRDGNFESGGMFFLTNKRILGFNLDSDKPLNVVAEAPFEREETFRSCLWIRDFEPMILTNKKLIYFKLPGLLGTKMIAKVFNPEDKISVTVIQRKKGIVSFFRTPYELTIRTKTETIKRGIEENELPIAKEIETMFSG